MLFLLLFTSVVNLLQGKFPMIYFVVGHCWASLLSFSPFALGLLLDLCIKSSMSVPLGEWLA